MENPKLNDLAFFCNHGWPIFPLTWLENGKCSCGSSSCKSPGKHPLVSRGFKDATTDITVVQNWLEKWPRANWGMRTGDSTNGGSGILVVDIGCEIQRNGKLGSAT